MAHINNEKILIHACCGICSGYPISYLKEMGYVPVVYFYNPNIDTEEEYVRRLDAQKTVCNYHNVELIYENYNHNEFTEKITGLENEPERGKRCDKCIELRLQHAAEKAKLLGIKYFTTSLVISPHKDYKKISAIGIKVSDGVEYVPEDFKKKDGFLKTNNLSKQLGLYRQKYCGCEFAKSHIA